MLVALGVAEKKVFADLIALPQMLLLGGYVLSGKNRSVFGLAVGYARFFKGLVYNRLS